MTMSHVTARPAIYVLLLRLRTFIDPQGRFNKCIRCSLSIEDCSFYLREKVVTTLTKHLLPFGGWMDRRGQLRAIRFRIARVACGGQRASWGSPRVEIGPQPVQVLPA